MDKKRNNNAKYFILLFSVFLISFSIASASSGITKWNCVTEDNSSVFSVDIGIDKSKEVEFAVSSDLDYDWTWSVNGEEREEIKESEGESSNLSFVFEDYGIYNVSVVGDRESETECAYWNVTVWWIIGEENDVRELEGLEDYAFRISKRPERIVSMAPSGTEILFAVGAGDSVVGVTSFCNYPPEVEEKKEKGEIEVIGGYSTPSLEKIVNLTPDLIVGAYGNPDDVIYWLIEHGYPVYAQNPKNIDGIFVHIKVTGAITKCTENTTSLLDDLKGAIEEIEERTELLEEEQRPRVFRPCPGFWTCGNETFMNDVIKTAGGENIAAKYFSGWQALGIEDIIKENPQVILCPATDEGESLAYEQIMGEERLKVVDAVRNNRVYLVNGDLICRPCPRVVNATEIVHEFLYGLFNIPEEGSTEIKGAYFGVLFITLELSAEENLALRLNISEANESEIEKAPEKTIGKYVRIEVNESDSGSLENISEVVVNIGYDEEEVEEAGMEENNIRVCFYNESEGKWNILKTDVSTEDNIASTGFSCLNEGIYGLSGFSRIFDSGAPENPYPSIFGTHYGNITPSHNVYATKLFTRACEGTGGHTEYVKIWNATWSGVEGEWKGYSGDWHNISFDEAFMLSEGETYYYFIRTGSYPQIHHKNVLEVGDGTITCTNFTDANGVVHYEWIPGIKIF
jgi:iron complex transport system substrate-binding protein